MDAAQVLNRRRRTHLDRSRRAWSMLLLSPLLLLLILAFFLPIGIMLSKSVYEPAYIDAFPRTSALLSEWDGSGFPDDATAAAFGRELSSANRQDLARAASRLNFDTSGFRSLIFSTQRKLDEAGAIETVDDLVGIDERWGDPGYWAAMKQASRRLTEFYLLAALDHRRGESGAIVQVPADRAVFVDVLLRTFWICGVVTVLCFGLGFPVAFLLASVPVRVSNLLIIFVLLPFWTSLLVRTTAWVVLLQRDGIINNLLMLLGLTSAPLELIYNRSGVYIALTHVLLPFMILPLYSVMKGINRETVRAAVSLGAHPFVAFARIYLPQTVPGIAAGCLLVFISALGFYVTPALVGGADDQMISYFIAFYTTQSVNWGLAGALGTILLLITAVLYVVYARLSGGAGVRLG